jgi:hypothetical protein
MKSYAFCPLSVRTINERVARINGAFTVLLLLLFVFAQSIIPLVFLVIDFLFRASDLSKFSPVAISSKNIVKIFTWNDKLINAGPKIFAARIGFLLSGLILLLFVFGAIVPAFIVAGILGLFSFLESAFGLCVACEIYPFIYRFVYRTEFQAELIN